MSVLTGRNKFNEIRGLVRVDRRKPITENLLVGSLGQHPKLVVEGVKTKMEAAVAALKKSILETRIKAAEEAFHAFVNELKQVHALKDAEFHIENPAVHRAGVDKYGTETARIEMEIQVDLKEHYNQGGTFGDVSSKIDEAWSNLDTEGMTFYVDESSWNAEDEEVWNKDDHLYMNIRVEVDDSMDF